MRQVGREPGAPKCVVEELRDLCRRMTVVAAPESWKHSRVTTRALSRLDDGKDLRPHPLAL
eukprot:8956835-Alexandrium_andersonii.AAC.1